jgi:hypothetical protein
MPAFIALIVSQSFFRCILFMDPPVEYDVAAAAAIADSLLASGFTISRARIRPQRKIGARLDFRPRLLQIC